MSYGYPGITSRTLPSDATVERTTIDGKPYLCVAFDVERERVQPLRLAAGLVGGPLVLAGASALRRDKPALSSSLAVVGVAMSAWSLWVWRRADVAMREGGR